MPRLILLLLLLGGCTKTLLVTVDKDKQETMRLESTRLFQQTSFSYDPTTGGFTYSSDPQGQQAVDLVNSVGALVLKAAAKGATAGAAP